VHRDLKAENVMVLDRRDEIDFVKVCDFGIAKVQDPKAEDPDSAITVAGMVCGTPEYMSPEQARGEPLDGRSDLYSLGILLYYMVTDRLPFTAETALGCVTRHLTEEPTPPREMRPDLDIPSVLDAFILRTIAKDPADRPDTATAFRDELVAVADQIAAGDPGEPAPTLPTALTPSAEAPVPTPSAALTPSVDDAVAPPRTSQTPLFVLAAVVLLSVGVGAYLLTRSADVRAPAPAAQAPEPDGAVIPAMGRTAPVVPDATAPRTSPPADATVVGPDATIAAGHRRRRRRRRIVRVMRTEPRARPMEPMKPMDQAPGKTPFQEAYDKACAAFIAGRVSAAARHYKTALRHKPGHARSIRELGRCYVRLGQPCRALRYYKRYARLRPGDFFVKRHIRTLSPRCGGKSPKIR
jgi:hypothetical protein